MYNIKIFKNNKIQRSTIEVSQSEKNRKFMQRSMLIGAVTLSPPTYSVVLLKAFQAAGWNKSDLIDLFQAAGWNKSDLIDLT